MTRAQEIAAMSDTLLVDAMLVALALDAREDIRLMLDAVVRRGLLDATMRRAAAKTAAERRRLL